MQNNFSKIESAKEWHKDHRMPEKASIKDRVVWHREHKQHCACRPIPHSLLPYLKLTILDKPE